MFITVIPILLQLQTIIIILLLNKIMKLNIQIITNSIICNIINSFLMYQNNQIQAKQMIQKDLKINNLPNMKMLNNNIITNINIKNVLILINIYIAITILILIPIPKLILILILIIITITITILILIMVIKINSQ